MKKQAMTRNEMRVWYVENIGYDPFDDDPTITDAEVLQIINDYIAEREEEEQA